MTYSPRTRVLIADDDPSVRISLTQYLDDLDFDTVPAASAEEALNLLSKQPCDAAIIDIRLPGIDGESLLIKAHEMYPDICFIIYTGSVEFSLSETLSSIGISQDQVFHKPVKSLRLLYETIIQQLENKGDGS